MSMALHCTPNAQTRECLRPCIAHQVHKHKYVHGRALHVHCIDTKLQALVYDTLPSTTAVFNYATGCRKLSANEQFFVDAQTVVSLLQTTQIISDVCFITMLLTPAQIKPKSFESRLNSFFLLFTRGGCASCLRACLGARLLPQS